MNTNEKFLFACLIAGLQVTSILLTWLFFTSHLEAFLGFISILSLWGLITRWRHGKDHTLKVTPKHIYAYMCTCIHMNVYLNMISLEEITHFNVIKLKKTKWYTVDVSSYPYVYLLNFLSWRLPVLWVPLAPFKGCSIHTQVNMYIHF